MSAGEKLLKSTTIRGRLRRYFRVLAKILALRYSRAFAEWRSHRRGRAPVTYSEKVRYRMAWDTNPSLTIFADKIAVRAFVAEVAGPQFLTEAFATCSRAEEVRWGELPRQYVFKVNHGSGAIIVVTEAADRSVHLPSTTARLGWAPFTIHPDNADPVRMEAIWP